MSVKAICRVEHSRFVNREIRSNFYVLQMEILEVIEGSQESLIREPFQPLFVVYEKDVEPGLYMCTIYVQIAGVTSYVYHGEKVFHKSTLNRMISVGKLSDKLKDKFTM